jgi:purine-binding chemotaxis protein CheW
LAGDRQTTHGSLRGHPGSVAAFAAACPTDSRRTGQQPRAPIGGSARKTTDVINFALDGEQYCIETRCVREVRRFGEVTRLPGVPDFLFGVTNLRGEIVPLIDIRRFLELPAKAPAVPSHVIICGDARAEFGIIADTIHDVSPVAIDELVPSPIGHSERSRDCVMGIARNATVVLNGFALLTDRRLFVEGTGAAATQNTGGDS